ncbi:hypothetical protein L1987_17886 [Smallanthus sonchifolius]|uniref:Uncharacterized protein n=1 Tax=Smallanthus sonchifolius TaxID=185202 RepID=A0ACB9IZ21_9ASTR|nr:hypothetical protein L1987_17886 [Smallanthus sonchifolius]
MVRKKDTRILEADPQPGNGPEGTQAVEFRFFPIRPSALLYDGFHRKGLRCRLGARDRRWELGFKKKQGSDSEVGLKKKHGM